MSNDPDQLRQTIERQHGGKAVLVQSIPVSESFTRNVFCKGWPRGENRRGASKYPCLYGFGGIVQFAAEAEALKKSHWPKCDELAVALAKRGPLATEALKAAMASRIHHVRSAALKALNTINPSEGRLAAEKLHAADRAFEVRETAASILNIGLVD
jgi:hypothetical protein